MDKNYWNNYYAENNQSQEPTSFAKSVANLIAPKSRVMELGCGTGRDSYYFMTKGHIVFACDQSEVIINNLSKSNNERNSYKNTLDTYKASYDITEIEKNRCVTASTQLKRTINDLNRELEIYKKLQDIHGIPDCFGMTWRCDLILEYIERQSYPDKQYELAGNQSFFQELLDLILNIHNKGIAHGDLKRKDNILVSQDNKPFLIDFGTAISIDNSKGRIKRFVFGFLKSTDLNAWIKHKYNRNYDDISEDDRQYYSPTLIEKCYRIIRKIFVKYG